jgi:hypothetical protein
MENPSKTFTNLEPHYSISFQSIIIVTNSLDPIDIINLILDGNIKYSKALSSHRRAPVHSINGCIIGNPTTNLGYDLINVNMTHTSTSLTVEFNGGALGIQKHMD